MSPVAALRVLASFLLGAAAVHSGSGITVDSAGRVYFDDTARNVVWRIEADGSLTAVAHDVHTNLLQVDDDGSLSYPPDGYPPEGFTYITDAPDGTNYATARSTVVRILGDGTTVRVAGDSLRGFRDGPAAGARFDRPQGLAVDSAGAIYVADHDNRRVRRIAPDGDVTTVAESGWPWSPVGLAVWGDRIYVLERCGNYFSGPPGISVVANVVGHPRVRMITPDGRIEVVAVVHDPGARFKTLLGLALSVFALAFLLKWIYGRRLRSRPA
jgi:sugar lactone lactonase YvrE